jgi:Domain of unknown function (DUF4145)
MAEEATKPPTIKAHCNDCLSETNHDVIARRKREWIDRDDQGNPVFGETMIYELVQCRGCENISLKRTYWRSDEEGRKVDYFPPAVSRRKPKWGEGFGWIFGRAQTEISTLFDEVYSAMFSGNNRLALMGVRAIIDVALTDKLGDIGGFAQKLGEAKAKGWITESHFKVLNIVVDAGNAASHRAYNPKIEQLNLILDVVENLIQYLYVIEEHAEEIAKETPARLNP